MAFVFDWNDVRQSNNSSNLFSKIDQIESSMSMRLHRGNSTYLILFTASVLSAVLFHTLRMSSFMRTLKTAPHISDPTSNCSPIMAKSKSSQYRDAIPFFNLIVHLPPSLFRGSSQNGLIPSLNKWNSVVLNSCGRLRWSYICQNRST